jgi:hypothetical protein
MFERSNRGSSSIRRGVVLALAAVLLLAESIAGAHFHQKDFRDNLTQSLRGNDGICSLCLFYSHAPASTGAAPISTTPFVAEEWITQPAFVRLFAPAVSLLFSRAPPASL